MPVKVVRSALAAARNARQDSSRYHNGAESVSPSAAAIAYLPTQNLEKISVITVSVAFVAVISLSVIGSSDDATVSSMLSALCSTLIIDRNVLSKANSIILNLQQ